MDSGRGDFIWVRRRSGDCKARELSEHRPLMYAVAERRRTSENEHFEAGDGWRRHPPKRLQDTSEFSGEKLRSQVNLARKQLKHLMI